MQLLMLQRQFLYKILLDGFNILHTEVLYWGLARLVIYETYAVFFQTLQNALIFPGTPAQLHKSELM
jgi:hypothetical protein